MRRWFKANRTYIFVAPIAMAMTDDGGCSSSTGEALTQDQFVQQIAGNTLQREGEEVFGFVEKDGSIRASIETPKGVKSDRGTWKFQGEAELCVEWEVTLHSRNNCAEMRVLEGGKYDWGGRTLVKLEGNPKDL